MPSSFIFFRITLASGSILVLLMSLTLNAVASILLAAPMQLIIGTPNLWHRLANSIFADTVSMQSTT